MVSGELMEMNRPLRMFHSVWSVLAYSFSMHPGCIGNEWVKVKRNVNFSSSVNPCLTYKAVIIYLGTVSKFLFPPEIIRKPMVLINSLKEV